MPEHTVHTAQGKGWDVGESSLDARALVKEGERTMRSGRPAGNPVAYFSARASTPVRLSPSFLASMTPTPWRRRRAGNPRSRDRSPA